MKQAHHLSAVLIALAVTSALMGAGCLQEEQTPRPPGEQTSAPETTAPATTVAAAPAGEPPTTYVQLIEFHKMQGIRNWVHELDQRGLSALINAQERILREHPDEFRVLADRGYEIAGGYHQEPFWDVNYSFQYEKMRAAKQTVENITGKEMRVFGSRYFAYDETTLKVADELGVDYILARGTDDVEAVIYEPKEYNVKIISVSNVEFSTMGRGSLCDYSLWARGATAEDFRDKMQSAIDKNPRRLMIVSHAYLGGMKESWWDVYVDFLDADDVTWAPDFDAWVAKQAGINREMPFEDIPVNREVQYVEPKPAEPLDVMVNVSEMHNPCAPRLQDDTSADTEPPLPEDTLVIIHNNQGPMCQDALGWISGLQDRYPSLQVQEYLTMDPAGEDMYLRVKQTFAESRGTSAEFDYLPVIVYDGVAYSGFTTDVRADLEQRIAENE